MPIQKGPSKLWFNLAIPATGEEMTIGATGIPDGTENPNAVWAGETDDGCFWDITKEITQEFVDDYKQPVDRSVDQTGMVIKANLVYKTLDFDVLAMASAGVGSAEVAAGYDKITYGEAEITLTCAAIIFPLKEDPTKFGCAQMYAGYNQAPVSRQASRQNRMVLPIELIGEAITSRPAADSLGQEWIQTS